MTETLDKASKAKDEKKIAAAPAPEAPKKARAVVVDPQRMQEAEYLRRDWVCTAEECTAVEDLLHPGYWSHVASQLKIYDHIEVRIDTGEFLLELLVKDCGRNWAQVVLLHHHDLVDPKREGSAVSVEIEPQFKGPLRKWCAIRLSDSAPLHEKMETKAQALEWISSYERTILAG